MLGDIFSSSNVYNFMCRVLFVKKNLNRKITFLKTCIHYPGLLQLLNHSRKRCGEGNGNPIQYSRLDNPMDGGAW